jgi:hypothetical protein
MMLINQPAALRKELRGLQFFTKRVHFSFPFLFGLAVRVEAPSG